MTAQIKFCRIFLSVSVFVCILPQTGWKNVHCKVFYVYCICVKIRTVFNREIKMNYTEVFNSFIEKYPVIYDCFAVGGIEGLNVADYFKEVPVGTGEVDFHAYLAALKKVGYDGYLTMEREAGGDRLKDIAEAKAFVENIIKG